MIELEINGIPVEVEPGTSLINAAKHVVFLITGEDKARTVAALFGGDPEACKGIPSARVAPTAGRLTYILDLAAAKLTKLPVTV